MNVKNWSINLAILATYKEHPDWPNKLIAQHHGVKQHRVEDVLYQARKKGIIPKAAPGERSSMRAITRVAATQSIPERARRTLSPSHKAALFAGRDRWRAERGLPQLDTSQEEIKESVRVEEAERLLELELERVDSVEPTETEEGISLQPYVVVPKRRSHASNPPKRGPATIHPLDDNYVAGLPDRTQPYSFGGGLYLYSSKRSGHKLWKHRYSVGKDPYTRREKWVITTIGVWPQMSANEAAREADNFQRGMLPVTEKEIPLAPEVEGFPPMTEEVFLAGAKRLLKAIFGR